MLSFLDQISIQFSFFGHPINPCNFSLTNYLIQIAFLFLFFFAKCSDPADILTTKSKLISKKSFTYQRLIWIL